jgi:hypothetical protein
MEGEQCRCQVLHRQDRELVHKVFIYFKHKAEAGMTIHDITKAQECTAKVCDIGITNVCKEG